MSDFYVDGSPRLWKTTKLLLNVQNIEAFQTYSPDMTLSQLMNNLLADWITHQALKAEFSKLNNGNT